MHSKKDFEDDPLNVENIIQSMSEEVYRVPIINDQCNRVFISEVESSHTMPNELIIVMDDGTSFVVNIRQNKT